jgi:glycosyltransferase involved in cell wall biosynthesis
MRDLRASVVIPCYNNARVLSLALKALLRQTVPLHDYEIIVVDDGSTDGTRDLLVSIAEKGYVHYIRQENQGAAAARNRGASEAKAEILVFLDSDVIADQNLLAAHLRGHGAYRQALLVGRTRSLAAHDLDSFYRTMGDEIFAWDLGDEETPIAFQQVLSRNLSIRRQAFLESGGFDESFPRSGFEDIEFAYRVLDQNLEIVYIPDASGVHHHTGTLAEVGQQMYNYQGSAALAIKKHPELKGQFPHLQDKEPICWRQDNLRLVMRKLARQVSALGGFVWLLRRAVSVLERWYPSPRLLKWLYWQILGSCLFAGFREGIRHYDVRF